MLPFGCPVFTHILDKLSKKINPENQQGLFLGYFDKSKGYRIWDIQQKKIKLSCNILFN